MTDPAVGPPPLTRLKAIGWSIAFFVLSYCLTLLVVSVIVLGIIRPPDVDAWTKTHPAAALVAQTIAMLPSAWFATWLIGIKRLRLTWSALRYRDAGPRQAGFGSGAALGVAAAVVALAVTVTLGRCAWTGDNGSFADYLVAMGKTVALLAPAAFSEEVIFRGVPLVLLASVFGRLPAIVALSFAFALAHAFNPNISTLALVNIAVAGILLGCMFYTPGGIWAAFGAHLGWNAALAAADAPVSGLPFSIPFIEYWTATPVWLTGGGFGPEGGLASTIGLSLAIALVVRRSRKELLS